MLLRQHFHLGRDDVPRCLAGSSHERPKFIPLAIWVHTLKMNPKVSLSIHKFRITELPSQPNTTSLLSCGYFQVAAVLQKSTQNVNQTWPPNLLLWVTEKMWPRAQDRISVQGLFEWWNPPTQRQLGSSWITCAGRSIKRFPSRDKIGGLQTDRSRFPDYFYLFPSFQYFSISMAIYGVLLDTHLTSKGPAASCVSHCSILSGVIFPSLQATWWNVTQTFFHVGLIATDSRSSKTTSAELRRVSSMASC